MYETQDEAAVYQALDAATLAFYEREMRFEDDPLPGGVPPTATTMRSRERSREEHTGEV